MSLDGRSDPTFDERMSFGVPSQEDRDFVIAPCSMFDSRMPCSFGACNFSRTGEGALTRSGLCSGTQGPLHLNSKGLTSLPADVFLGMSGMT